jgi:oligopeptide/dipeptide ABC transporter ATP-binding protein
MNAPRDGHATTAPPFAASEDVLLSIRHLSVRFPTSRGLLHAVEDVSLDLPLGSVLAIVGESGSGKSVLSRAIMRLLPRHAQIPAEAGIHFDGIDLLRASEKSLQAIRGRRIGMVFQDPMTSLNPVRTVGSQLAEGMRRHLRIDGRTAKQRTIELLQQVGIASPERRYDQYPHELSGGMRQRVVIAMAIACEPDLLIADEPTTALDVTIQAEILELLRSLRTKRAMTMIMVTHDLGVAAEQADEIAVMYAGQIVERANVRSLFSSPRMPYTGALLKAIPKLSDPPHTELYAIPGSPPAVVGTTQGCRFAPRCERELSRCRREAPSLIVESDRGVRCWNPLEAS